MASLECVLDVLSLAWLKSSTDRQDVKDFVDWKLLWLLLLAFLGRLVLLLDCVEAGRFLLEEAPFIAHWHLGDVGENKVLSLRGIV